MGNLLISNDPATFQEHTAIFLRQGVMLLLLEIPDVWDQGRLTQRQSFHISLWFSVSFLPLLIYLHTCISSFLLLSLLFYALVPYMFFFLPVLRLSCLTQNSEPRFLEQGVWSFQQVMLILVLLKKSSINYDFEMPHSFIQKPADVFQLSQPSSASKFFLHSKEEQKSVMVTHWFMTLKMRTVSVRCSQCPDSTRKQHQDLSGHVQILTTQVFPLGLVTLCNLHSQ